MDWQHLLDGTTMQETKRAGSPDLSEKTPSIRAPPPAPSLFLLLWLLFLHPSSRGPSWCRRRRRGCVLRRALCGGRGGRRLRRSPVLHLLHEGEVKGVEAVEEDGGVGLELYALRCGEGMRSAENQTLYMGDDGAHCRVVGDFEDELARAICRLPPLDAVSRLLGCIQGGVRSR